MKDKSKEILAAAIGLAAVSALGVLINGKKNRADNHKTAGTSCQSRKRERLYFVKNKLEMHRERLDHHLNRINSKIESLSPREPIGHTI
jgi:hypothetical protein